MPVNVNQQTMVFLMCFLTGTASGVICDFLNVTAKKLRFNKSAFFIQDIVIWLVILAFFFSVLYRINGAMLRWYVFLGAGLGAVVYILVFHMATVRAARVLVETVAVMLHKTAAVLLFPVRKIAILLRPLAKYVQNKQKKLSKFVQKMVEKIRRIRLLLKKV